MRPAGILDIENLQNLKKQPIVKTRFCVVIKGLKNVNAIFTLF